MPRLTPDQLARLRADYHQCGVTVLPLVAEIEAAWADLAAARADRDRLLAECGRLAASWNAEIRRNAHVHAERDHLAAAAREAVLSLAEPECDRGRVLRLLHEALEGEGG